MSVDPTLLIECALFKTEWQDGKAALASIHQFNIQGFNAASEVAVDKQP